MTFARIPSSPSTARTRYHRDDVILAACELLDTGGLASLTMRRLATHLDVQPSALYWHFRDKQTLLAALSHHILSTSTTNQHLTSLPWEQCLREAAMSLRESLLRHTDGAELVSSSLALGRVELPLRSQIGPTLRTEGASEAVIDAIAHTVGHYVVGATFHEQQRQSMATIEAAGTTAETTADTPLPTRTTEDAQHEFAQGVELIIAGAAVLLSMGVQI